MFSRFVEKLDRIPELPLLIVNICLAAFVILAHGGYLAATYIQGEGQVEQALSLVLFSLPLATLVIITSIVGFLKKGLRESILKLHAVILALGAVASFVWSVSILFGGFPESNFSWSPGLLTVLCVYPVYLLRRAVFSGKLKVFFIKYLHVFCFVLVMFVDIGVFSKFIYSSDFLAFERATPNEKLIQKTISEAWKLEDQKKRSKAIRLTEEALRIAEESFGQEHHTVARCLYALGFFHSHEGEYAKAESLYRRALAIQEKVYGADHPELASTTNNLGFLYMSQGKYDEAERFFKRTLSIREKEHDWGAMWSLDNLVCLYYKQGRYSEVEPVLQRALSISEKLQDDSQIIKFLSKLSDVYSRAGRKEDKKNIEERITKIESRKK